MFPSITWILAKIFHLSVPGKCRPSRQCRLPDVPFLCSTKGRFPHPDLCQYYYTCTESSSYAKLCSCKCDGMYYDVMAKRCKLATSNDILCSHNQYNDRIKGSTDLHTQKQSLDHAHNKANKDRTESTQIQNHKLNDNDNKPVSAAELPETSAKLVQKPQYEITIDPFPVWSITLIVLCLILLAVFVILKLY